MSDEYPDEDRELILAEIIEGLIEGHHRLGHEILALQGVCGHLLASQCSNTPEPIAAVERAVALLSVREWLLRTSGRSL